MYTCIIIDDENRSVETLSKIVTTYCEDKLEILATANNIDDAYPLIKNKKPDVIFLDIEMPFGSGFDLLERFDEIDFQVIFTTGFDQYAITAIKFSALDYLLKPINIAELKMAVDKAIVNIENTDYKSNFKIFLDTLKKTKNSTNKIPLPVLNGLELVQIDHIVYCEADEDYTHVFLQDGTKKIVTKSIKDFEELLETYDFFRIHHSFLVNKKYIKKYTKGEGGTILTDLNVEIPVSRRRKSEFLEWLNDM
jgi:two-component system, LytTR family, response regulator